MKQTRATTPSAIGCTAKSLVYYNPERVTESVLDQSAPPSAYLSINLGLALATASAALLMMSLRANSRAPRARPSTVG